MEGGRITEAGAYAELIDADGDFAEFIRTFTAVEENEEGDPGRHLHNYAIQLIMACSIVQCFIHFFLYCSNENYTSISKNTLHSIIVVNGIKINVLMR